MKLIVAYKARGPWHITTTSPTMAAPIIERGGVTWMHLDPVAQNMYLDTAIVHGRFLWHDQLLVGGIEEWPDDGFMVFLTGQPGYDGPHGLPIAEAMSSGLPKSSTHRNHGSRADGLGRGSTILRFRGVPVSA